MGAPGEMRGRKEGAWPQGARVARSPYGLGPADGGTMLYPISSSALKFAVAFFS